MANAVIEKDDDLYVSLCPKLDMASQGQPIEEEKNKSKKKGSWG